MMRPTRVDPGVALGHDPPCIGIGMLVIERAELADFDHLVVEAEAALAEQHRAGAVQLDGDGGREHPRRKEDEDHQPGHAVEQRLHHHVSSPGDRLVENIEHRDVADIGIDAGGGIAGGSSWAASRTSTGSTHSLLHHLEHPFLRRQRQRYRHEIDPGEAGELDEILAGSELGDAGDHQRRAFAAAIVDSRRRSARRDPPRSRVHARGFALPSRRRR